MHQNLSTRKNRKEKAFEAPNTLTAKRPAKAHERTPKTSLGRRHDPVAMHRSSSGAVAGSGTVSIERFHGTARRPGGCPPPSHIGCLVRLTEQRPTGRMRGWEREHYCSKMGVGQRCSCRRERRGGSVSSFFLFPMHGGGGLEDSESKPCGDGTGRLKSQPHARQSKPYIPDPMANFF
jgi:hypothetical protein